MSTVDADELRRLLDKQAIWEVLLRYTRGLDRMDWALLASCYHPDAHHDHGMWQGPAAEFVQYCARHLATMDRTLHTVENALIVPSSAIQASSEAYCTALHRIPSTKSASGFANHTVFVRYLDRFERRGDGPWRIARRTVVFEWSVVDPIDREWNLTGAYARGSRSRADPAYALGALPEIRDAA
ncbi:MAG: nuclear transport factor 2 family protein [Lautropia sp.]